MTEYNCLIFLKLFRIFLIIFLALLYVETFNIFQFYSNLFFKKKIKCENFLIVIKINIPCTSIFWSLQSKQFKI